MTKVWITAGLFLHGFVSLHVGDCFLDFDFNFEYRTGFAFNGIISHTRVRPKSIQYGAHRAVVRGIYLGMLLEHGVGIVNG